MNSPRPNPLGGPPIDADGFPMPPPRGGFPERGAPRFSEEDHEQMLQSTTDDAAACKLSAVQMKYYDDAYIQHFVRRRGERKSVLMNRGSYARVRAIRKVVETFIDSAGGPCQVVNLGAGLDSLGFWVRSTRPQAVYFEVDFPEIVSRKTRTIMQKKQLLECLGVTEETLKLRSASGVQAVTTDTMRLVPADLRDLDEVRAQLAESGMSDLPTLFVCECVLVYLHQTQSDAIVSWIAQALTAPTAIVTYEHANPDTPFGQQMVKNLAARGCPLLSLPAYPTLEAQKQRYREKGWEQVECNTMLAVFDSFEEEERRRVCKIEWLDEVEEWNLLLGHYMFLVACRGDLVRPVLSALAALAPSS